MIILLFPILTSDYALLLSFVGQARLQFARLHSCLLFLWCCSICKAGIFAVSDAFFDAVVSAWMRYLLLQMLFSCQSCIIASAIYLFHDLQILISEKRYPQFTYSKTCRCQPPHKIASATCLFQTSQILPTLLPLHNLNFVI